MTTDPNTLTKFKPPGYTSEEDPDHFLAIVGGRIVRVFDACCCVCAVRMLEPGERLGMLLTRPKREDDCIKVKNAHRKGMRLQQNPERYLGRN